MSIGCVALRITGSPPSNPVPPVFLVLSWGELLMDHSGPISESAKEPDRAGVRDACFPEPVRN
jgi:hypothetical protein